MGTKITDYSPKIFEIFNKKWAILTAGTKDEVNSMTVSWGGLGTLWGKPVATVYVRKSRYTHEFMDKSDVFTLSFYSEEQRPALKLMGAVSGRDRDKVKESGLTPIVLDNGAVTYNETEITIVCKKLYKQPMDPSQIPDEARVFYKDGDYHDIYIAEVIEILEK